MRARALAALRAAPDLTIRADAERLLHDPDIEVRTEALLWLAYHAQVDPLAQIDALGDFEDFSIRASIVALYSRPGRYQNLEAARVLLGAMANERGPEGRRARVEAAMLLGRLSGDDRRRAGRSARRSSPTTIPKWRPHAVDAAAKAVAPGPRRRRRHAPRGRRRPPRRARRAVPRSGRRRCRRWR